MNQKYLKQYGLWTLVLVIVLILESKVRIVGIKLNLLILFAYFAGLRHGPVKGLLYGAGLGILADTMAGGMLGPRMFSLGAVGYMASFLTGRLFTWTPMLGFFAVAVLTMADGLLSYAALIVFGASTISLGQAAIIVFWQASMNAFIGPCIRPEHEN